MSKADTHIRVSRDVKDRLERRKAADESFSDVIDRNLDRNADFYDGFGSGSDERSESLRKTYEKGRTKSKQRVKTLSEQRQRDEADQE